MITSAFTLAYHGFFRICEIVRNKMCQAHQVLAILNVTLSKRDHVEIAKIVIPFSKTNQFGHGTCIEIKETSLKDCPINWLKNSLMQRPKVKVHLFCHFGGSSVTRFQCSCVLSKGLIHVGITDSVSFRTYTFRISAAINHFAKEASEEEIMRLGRWKSNAFKGYTRQLVQSKITADIDFLSKPQNVPELFKYLIDKFTNSYLYNKTNLQVNKNTS